MKTQDGNLITLEEE